ncbi:MAG: c-type cytochrome [bacterium]|nr:c-type cytochrome [bacterium]
MKQAKHLAVFPGSHRRASSTGKRFLKWGRWGCLALLAGVCLKFAVAAEKESAVPKSPLSPEESLKQTVVHPDFEMQVVASEPNVVNPVAVAFDESGVLWVVEMTDYPHGPKEGEDPKSRIKLLRDKDQDGFYETATVFADKLLFATGVQPWKGGLIVTLAGKVQYMKDTDGDDKADLVETWFTGFKEENSQLRANHPTLGLDNHIYISNGLRGGSVIATHPEWTKNAKQVPINGLDFRFHPLTGKYESISGIGQFGLTFDDYCNRFVCSNRNPNKHIVLESRYLKRNPYLAVKSVYHDVSPDGEDSRVYAISRTWTTSTLHAGQFTAACGVTIYRGDLFPKAFYGNSFTCEPTANLVHRDVMTPMGATYDSKYGRDKVEFIASRDEWFRPVNMYNGPDGALYLCDMYRAVIEHPQFMPVELKERSDLNDGIDRGRIYRIVPKKSKINKTVYTALKDATQADLIAALSSKDSWQRETAARLIFEGQDASLQPALEKLVTAGKNEQARIQALWSLEGLGKLSDAVLMQALKDQSPRVQGQAVRLSEPRLGESQDLKKQVLALVDTADPALRFQLAISLGEAGDSSSMVEELAQLMLQGADDSWTRAAVLSSAADQSVPIFKSFLKQLKQTGQKVTAKSSVTDAVGEMAAVIGPQLKSDDIQETLSLIAGLDADSYLPLQIAGFEGLGNSLRRRGKSIAAYQTQLSEADQKKLNQFYQKIVETAANPKSPLAQKLEAISVLQFVGFDAAGKTLLDLIQGKNSQAVKIAAIEAISPYGEAQIGPVLMDGFAQQTPGMRRAILDAMLASQDRTNVLLDEIEKGEIKISELGPARSTRLQRNRDAGIKKRAAALFAAAIPADRKQVLADYQKSLKLKADPLAGKQIFVKNCVTCHRIGELGVNVAPDIGDSRTKTPEYLLTNILDPNRAIDANFFSYTIITIDGVVHTGIISSDSGGSITLTQPEGKTITVLKDEIDEMKSNGVSLMPVGLEKTINPQQMADLISFIKNWRYLDGQVPKDIAKPQ